MSKEWTSIAGGQATTLVTGTFLPSSLTVNIAATVLRMIGEYVIAPTGALTALDECVVTVGIGVISGDAAELGATAVPDPAAEPNYPWLYFASHAFLLETVVSNPAIAVRKSFDIRSMRKMKPRENLAMIVQYQNVVGDPAYSFSSGVTRVLVATG